MKEYIFTINKGTYVQFIRLNGIIEVIKSEGVVRIKTNKYLKLLEDVYKIGNKRFRIIKENSKQ